MHSITSRGVEVDRRILFTGDKERDELAREWEVETDDVDERESDLLLFPALGMIFIS